MQKIKILSDDPLAVALWNAMCNNTKAGEVLDKFKLEPKGDESEVEIKILVNGIEVDLVGELTNFVKSVDKTLEDAVKNYAMDIITKDRNLLNLQYEIEQAEWKIRDKLEALMKD